VGEQFAADLQTCFPRLVVRAVSANKVLGLWGQDFSIPQTGHPVAEGAWDLRDTVALVVSHSGGTFGSLAVTSLLQGMTPNIFAVTSEWDSQVGKQLRGLDAAMFESRVFVTGAGLRPAEPCSLSVAATHVLLTQILEHVALVITRSREARQVTACTITDGALGELCRNAETTPEALRQICGVAKDGRPAATSVSRTLVLQGEAWADHVLEAPRAWLLSAFYIVGTVTAGWVPITSLAIAVGVDGPRLHVALFFDALIFVFLAEIMTALIRLCQGRTLMHRMGGRSIVIGDVPWVAQCAEAFLSKCFACSYAFASVAVYSANPGDHLVHRMTHRVVRGALLACGRPDGRIPSLTSAENAVCLSTNQASSIQSLGVTCESLTIGHNPHKLPLTKHHITLPTHRPKYLAEQFLDEHHEKHDTEMDSSSASSMLGEFMSMKRRSSLDLQGQQRDIDAINESLSARGLGSARSVLGLKTEADSGHPLVAPVDVRYVRPDIAIAVEACFKTGEKFEREQREKRLRGIFNAVDVDCNGSLSFDEFSKAYRAAEGDLSAPALRKLFDEADADGGGELDFDEFARFVDANPSDVLASLGTVTADVGASTVVEPSDEASLSLRGCAADRSPRRRGCDVDITWRRVVVTPRLRHGYSVESRGRRGCDVDVRTGGRRYHGETLRQLAPNTPNFDLVQAQTVSCRLYESRVASLERFVAFCVLFHALAAKVAAWWPRWTFGVFRYRIDRTHSIMRVATTASPVSGADLRERMRALATRSAWLRAFDTISTFTVKWRIKRALTPRGGARALGGARWGTPTPRGVDGTNVLTRFLSRDASSSRVLSRDD